MLLSKDQKQNAQNHNVDYSESDADLPESTKPQNPMRQYPNAKEIQVKTTVSVL